MSESLCTPYSHHFANHVNCPPSCVGNTPHGHLLCTRCDQRALWLLDFNTDWPKGDQGPSLPSVNLDPYQTTRDDQLRMYALDLANQRRTSANSEMFFTDPADAVRVAEKFYAFLTKP